ncbi:hypothetical protein CYY_009506 [Polysphondylium violaceum]|uniref:Uncharacterized protein n=1 Tax=Polysphondylium violaceum TaxID=133409 RepID=A0A8J4PJZ1_9MYCE|nr:hypothetical protein CYY_009506 [Polysphondylium violaceum]
MNLVNKENQVNRATERVPLGNIKQSSNIVHSNNVSGKSSNFNNGGKSVEQQLRDLEEKLKSKELELKHKDQELKQKNQELKHKDQEILSLENQLNSHDLYSSNSTNSKIQNNRVRKIQQLVIDNSNLQERVKTLEENQIQYEKLSNIQNNQRIRLIHKLKNENRELLHELKQRPTLVKVVATESSTPVQQPTAEPILLNYSHSHPTRSLNFTQNYGNDVEYHPGEC